MNPKTDPIKTALLVVDVQHGLFQKSTPVYRSEALLGNILNLVEAAHRAGVPVVYIQHDDSTGLKKGSPAWQLHPRLHPLETDLSVHKQSGNSFKETPLGELLQARQVNHVVVTGMVTHGCVKSTCLGGRELGYKVTLVSDAHSSYSQDAEQLIEKWHAKLVKEGVALQAAAEIAF
jgi:nicotinamidase-related amidase